MSHIREKTDYPFPSQHRTASVVTPSWRYWPIGGKGNYSQSRFPEIPQPVTPPAPVEAVADYSRLDMKIGLILNVTQHPIARTYYVSQIDIGQEKPVQSISELYKHHMIEEMLDELVVVLCNIKPVTIKGITSYAMIMCAMMPYRVEMLVPPAGSVPGDLVEVEGYKRNPDKELDPKKKTYEKIAEDLKTNLERVATYKGIPCKVAGKGNVTTKSIKREARIRYGGAFFCCKMNRRGPLFYRLDKGKIL